MAGYPAPIEALIERLLRLPGVGRRSAARIAFHLARRSPDEVRALAQAIGTLPDALTVCSICGNLAPVEAPASVPAAGAVTPEPSVPGAGARAPEPSVPGAGARAPALCPVCTDARRDRSIVCVVEQADNLAAIERTGAFRGVYHVLGGAISPLRGIGPEHLRIDTLLGRLRDGAIRELILATNPTVEGEATALYVARLTAGAGVRVTRPATGLPVGGELEYVDQATLARAFEGRRDVPDS